LQRGGAPTALSERPAIVQSGSTSGWSPATVEIDSFSFWMNKNDNEKSPINNQQPTVNDSLFVAYI
jgi:hypothetical protein